MPTSSTGPPLPTSANGAGERPANNRRLPDAAIRALAEAAARRIERRNSEAGKPQGANELGGRGGLDPARYGDWEVNGLASDF